MHIRAKKSFLLQQFKPQKKSYKYFHTHTEACRMGFLDSRHRHYAEPKTHGQKLQSRRVATIITTTHRCTERSRSPPHTQNSASITVVRCTYREEASTSSSHDGTLYHTTVKQKKKNLIKMCVFFFVCVPFHIHTILSSSTLCML